MDGQRTATVCTAETCDCGTNFCFDKPSDSSNVFYLPPIVGSGSRKRSLCRRNYRAGVVPALASVWNEAVRATGAAGLLTLPEGQLAKRGDVSLVPAGRQGGGYPPRLASMAGSIILLPRWSAHGENFATIMYQPKNFSDIAEPFSELSHREQQVVTLVCEGLSNKEIATRLGVTEGTIKLHLHSIFVRLGVRSRIELMIALAGRK
jgi:DNA-binding CsgD family transcriptional regulator